MFRAPACILLFVVTGALLRAADDFAANSRLGEFYIERHNLAAAIPYLERAYALDSNAYSNAYNLALAYLEAGKLESAAQTATALLKQQNRAELHNLLGDIREAKGEVDAAAREYQTAAMLDPSEKNVFDFADDLLSHRDYQQALQIFEYGATKYPRSPRLRVGLGVAEYSLGDYAKAVQSLCQAVDLNPGDTKVLDFLGKMYDVSPEMAEEVTKRLARFVRLYPDSAPANYYYALSLRKRVLAGPQQNRDAEALLEKAVQLDPKFADAHYQLGLLFEDQGENQKAIREYEIAAKLDAGSKMVHYRLARLYAKAGHSDLARKEFQLVQKLGDPQSPER